MASQIGLDWSKWYIYRASDQWFVCPAEGCGEDAGNVIFKRDSFTEAYAAYLDAVTCDAQTPFAYYTEPRCSRARGHEGAHRFVSKNPGNAPLHVNPK